MRRGVLTLAAGLLVLAARMGHGAEGYTHTFPLGAAGLVAVTNSQVNSSWTVAAVLWQYQAAGTGTVTVSRVSQGFSVLLAWRTYSNKTSIVWVPEGSYSFGYGEALIISSSAMNGVVQVNRRGE